jgi:type II secretory pathway component PulK
MSTINANTAPPEVLMGAIPIISRSEAQQIVLARQSNPFTDPLKIWNALHIANTGPVIPPTSPPLQVNVKSFHFEIFGQLRYEQHVVRERSIVFRPGPGQALQVLRRERIPPDPS